MGSLINKLWKNSKGFLGIIIGTFLSLQIAPTVSLAIYSNLMTPWKNQDRIIELENKIWRLELRLNELKRNTD